jgi:hypothetical protein
LHFSFFTFFSFSFHISRPRVCISHFASFWVSLATFQVLQCALLLFAIFSVSRYFVGHTVFLSHFPRFSVFSL